MAFLHIKLEHLIYSVSNHPIYLRSTIQEGYFSWARYVSSKIVLFNFKSPLNGIHKGTLIIFLG